MSNVVFMVKNGIGYGHLRRALLLARALQDTRNVRPIVISQASTLDLFRDCELRVLNLPLIERTGSDVLEDRYTEILDHILTALDPALVIEDTYPDPRYLALPSLAGTPRMLIMRRLDGTSLDQIRTTGRLAHYDEILITQTREEFHQEGHSGQSLTAVEATGRFTFVGNIHATPSAADAAREKNRYAPHGAPLVVAAAGAGGDQMADGFCDRLFHACATTAAALLDEAHPARFVFVTGPYYAGRELTETPNVTVHRYHPRLAALLRAADVAVLKPGNNVVSETLLGHANLVLSPDTSFMEGLDEHTSRLVTRYGGAVVPPTGEAISEAIRAALAAPRRTQNTAQHAAGVTDALTRIERWALDRAPSSIEPKQLLLLIRTPEQPHPHTLTDTASERAGLLSQFEPSQTWPTAVIIDRDPPQLLHPQALADAGTRLLLLPDRSPHEYAARRWLTLKPPRPGTILHPLTLAQPRTADAALRIITRATMRADNPTAILLDLRGHHPAHAQNLIAQVRIQLATQPAALADLETAITTAAQTLIYAKDRPDQ